MPYRHRAIVEEAFLSPLATAAILVSAIGF
jgi:hypothetical protein